jgi:pimeloyl-ACP methyl ester carboxylesterase
VACHLPALVVWGEQDRLVSVVHGQAYADALPDSRLVVVPDAGQ